MSQSLLLSRFVELTRERADHLAIIDDREAVSFALLGRRVQRVAAELRTRGLGGKRVALLVSQGSGWVETFLGIIAADAVAVPLSHLHPEAEQAWFVEVSRASAIIVSADTDVARWHTRRLSAQYPQATVTLGTKDAARALAAQMFQVTAGVSNHHAK